jgi:hypothetical protein
MAEPTLLAARADLIARGFIGSAAEGYPLTPAGHAHAERNKAELLEAEAPEEPAKPRVRWNFRRVGHRRA